MKIRHLWSNTYLHCEHLRVRLGNEEQHCRRVSLPRTCRDCRLSRWLRYWQSIQEAKCSWHYAGQEVIICTTGGKNQIVQVILLPNLRVCSLALIISLLSENVLFAIVTHSNDKRLICHNTDRYTRLSLPFAMNTADHINVVFRKSTYSLMSRVTTGSLSTGPFQETSPLHHLWFWWNFTSWFNNLWN